MGSLVFLFVTFTVVLTKDLPSHFPLCGNNDAKTNTCFVNASDMVRESLVKGIRDLGIPPIDPLFIPSITFEQGSKSLNFKIDIHNATISGLGQYQFDEFWFDQKEMRFHNHGKLGSLKLVGNCDFNGKILIVPLRGHGTITTTLAPTEFTGDISGKLVNRNGVDYFKITDVKVHMPLEDGVSRFDNFTGAPPEIVTGINQVFEENSKEMIQEIAAPIQKITLDITRTVYEGITSRVPYNKLFRIGSPKK